MPARIDIERRSPQATELVRALRHYGAHREAMRTIASLAEMTKQLEGVLGAAAGASHLLVSVEGNRTASALDGALEGFLTRIRPLSLEPFDGSDPWTDFLRRPADYFSWLSELGFAHEDESKVQGDLPHDIVEAIRNLELRGDYLRVSLRGYQSFAARFALVQKRVLIGDEMGLGKTGEALAVLAHLRATGGTHFLVLCPAAVVTNWMREIEGKTALRAHRLHGYEREQGLKNWCRLGGVAVTTFESLGWFLRAADGVFIDGLIADEAHALKNPAAQRSARAASVMKDARHVVLMTGTPLENRVEEFRQLITYVRPDLLKGVTDFAPRRFRKEVAPAYLRRNQEDVLTELPELVEVDEWVTFSVADEARYRAAVRDGNFMAMRQAAMLSGEGSAKQSRLRELIEEAEENGRKVLVFSYFRDVLQSIATLAPGRVFGPLTGSVPAHARQTMVDEFAHTEGGAVLVAQIQAGGVGLNIQAASVVIICEPQIKPTLEQQAVARAHRMGQLHKVQVHRLLSDQGVDERITQLLAEKRRLFDEFARTSETAASAPEAYDLSEAELARLIVDEERHRILGSGAQ